jgi:enoyl-[acyl-carrier protein] reductase III
MTQPLKGKTALITGASRGIGRAIAFELARRGANILLNFVRNEEAAKKTQQELEALGVKVLPYQGNAGDPKAIEEMVQLAGQTLGSIDILIHNAALGAFKPVHQLKSNQWDLSMEINVKALFLLVQKALPWLEKANGASVVALSSLGSRQFIPNYGAIGISKAALENLVRYLAVELAGKNIRVNCVSGGPVDTDAIKFFPDYEGMKREVVKCTPAGRIAQPEDLAKVVAFLCLPESNWIYGQTLIADGGLSLT